MTTGERMKFRRKELGLSADEVAAALNVSRATIFRYEKGDIEKLPGSALEPLAKALHTTPAYLMGWEESPSGSDEKTADPKAGGGESLEDIIPGYDSLSDLNKNRVRDYVAVLLAAQQNQ